jgi:hypothetical protein
MLRPLEALILENDTCAVCRLGDQAAGRGAPGGSKTRAFG